MSPRLTLNVGVRWDVETNMLNNDYVTPDSVRQTVAAFVATLPCDGVDTVRSQLCDPLPYLTDGDDRPIFMRAIKPRVGFSYDAFGTGNTVIFGGWGLYYDRNRYGNVLSESGNLQWSTYTFRFSADGQPVNGNPTIQWQDSYITREGLQSILAGGSAPEPELFLTENSTRPPRAHQYSIGVRQAIRDYAISVSYTGVRGDNVFTWIRANRNPNGSCCSAAPVGYSNVFVSSDDAKNWYDALYLKGEKRYSQDSRWGAQIAYTLARAEEEADAGGVFSALNVYNPRNFVRYPSPSDERHHVTANWVVGLPFDVMFSGIIDLGSGNAYNATVGFGAGTNNCTFGNKDCLSGNDYPPGNNRNSFRPERHSFIIPDFWAFRNVDVRLEKTFDTVRGQQVGISAEVFNLFDFANFSSFDLTYGNYQSDGQIAINRNFGTPRGVITDTRVSGSPRRFQFGMRYKF